MEFDATTAANNATFTGDVCIVGAGPVGLSLAAALAERERDVVLIDSAATADDPGIDELNDGDLSGDLVPDLRALRTRAIGGSAAIWNTYLDAVRSARLVPLDPADFSRRAWRDGAEWPIDYATMARYYPAAMAHCGLGPFEFGASMAHPDRPPPVIRGEAGRVAAAVYQVASSQRFTVELPAMLRRSPRVMLVAGATATGIDVSTDRTRVNAVRLATLTGGRATVRATHFVLAAGGIENPRRLLLWADALGVAPSPWLGRGFMQHPWERSLELVSRDPAFAEAGGFFAPHRNGLGVGIMGRIALTASLIEEEGIGNAGVYLIALDQPHLLVAGAARTTARRMIPALRWRRTIGGAVRGAASLVWKARGAPCTVEIYVEQPPHFGNRVALSTRRDAFGDRLPAVEWRLVPSDHANLVRTRDVVARELQRAGLGRVRTTRRPIVEHENHHHIGATRMHPDPAQGVVDGNLRVHGVENLHVAGASVFPTGGFANPTLSAIALGQRLADHLTAR